MAKMLALRRWKKNILYLKNSFTYLGLATNFTNITTNQPQKLNQSITKKKEKLCWKTLQNNVIWMQTNTDSMTALLQLKMSILSLVSREKPPPFFCVKNSWNFFLVFCVSDWSRDCINELARMLNYEFLKNDDIDKILHFLTNWHSLHIRKESKFLH